VTIQFGKRIIFILCISIVTTLYACSGASPSQSEQTQDSGTHEVTSTPDASQPEQMLEQVAEKPSTPEPQAEKPAPEPAQPKPPQWGKKSIKVKSYAGVPLTTNLPAIEGGTPPFSFTPQGAVGNPFLQVKEGKLTMRWGYKSPLESFQLIVKDSKGKTDTLKVTAEIQRPLLESMQATLLTPPARANPALVLSSHALYVLGGSLEGNQEDKSLWRMDRKSRSWKQLKNKGTPPPAALAIRMALMDDDEADGIVEGVVMQGMLGNNSGFNTPYHFKVQNNEVTWTLLKPVGFGPPKGLTLSVIGYDPANKRFMLFGGLETTTSKFNDTLYILQKTDSGWGWSIPQLKVRPSGRFGALYAVDHKRQKMYVASGQQALRGFDAFATDLWELDFKGALAWKKIETKGTITGRRNGIMLLDVPRNRVFLWGGASAGMGVKDLDALCLDDKTPTWESIFYNPKLSGRTSIAAATDSQTGINYFGFGRNPTFLGDVWKFNP